MFELIFEYWIEIFFSLVCGAFGYVIKKILSLHKKQKAVEKGVLALLRNELIKNYREYERRGEMSILDKENLTHMFEEYKNLGGNGTVKKMYEELMNLKTEIIE